MDIYGATCYGTAMPIPTMKSDVPGGDPDPGVKDDTPGGDPDPGVLPPLPPHVLLRALEMMLGGDLMGPSPTDDEKHLAARHVVALRARAAR